MSYDFAALELGYRPNLSARSVKTQRFDSAMLIQVVEKSHHRLSPGIVDGIADGLAAAGRPMLIERLVLADLATGGSTPRSLRHAMVDGLLVHVDVEPSPQVDAMLNASGLPLIWINRQRPWDAVCPDDVDSAALMTRRLIAAGHQHIAWLDLQVGYRDPVTQHYSRTSRIASYQTVMQQAGLTAAVLSPPYEPGESGHMAWLEARLRVERPTALACYGSYEALTVMHVVGRLGWRIPDDLSLITIHFESLMAGLCIDVAALPSEAIGRAAAAMLVERIASHQQQPAKLVPFRLIPGATVAPPRA